VELYDAIDILLIDDSDSDAEITLRMLKKAKVNNRIFRARDGLEGLAFIFREDVFSSRDMSVPKLVLLDINMPTLDGTEVLRRLKSSDGTRTIPIIMLTSSAADLPIRVCAELGASGFLTKPVTIEEFAQLVSTLPFIHIG
jgi:two-component system response regulator